MASHVGLEAWVVSLLQDKLLAVVAAVLEPHPAAYKTRAKTDEAGHECEREADLNDAVKERLDIWVGL